MRLIFSKDRAAQLDLLLRSLERHAPHEATRVIWLATTGDFAAGYETLPLNRSMTNLFDLELRRALWECPDETVTFFCDDDVVFDTIPHYDLDQWFGTWSYQVLCVSLRLGKQNKTMPWPGEVWSWPELPRTDYGFPASIDGHTFRVKDVFRMIEGRKIPNPSELESVMMARCELFAHERPLMGSFEWQSLVGIPVNRVSEQSRVPFGTKYPQTTRSLNKRFLAGHRIDLDALDFSGVAGCHKEIMFEWEAR
jgi:hypothetical protein